MKNKVLSLFLATLMVASVVGVAYSAWKDEVYIEGTAEMGSLTFGFTTLVGSWDSEDYEGYPPEKCTAVEECLLFEEETDVHTTKKVYKLLTFTVTDAYPNYWAINKFTLDNAGTIPLCIDYVTITLPLGYNAVPDAVYPGRMWHIQDPRGEVVFNLWLYKEPEDYGPGWANDPPWKFPGDPADPEDPFGARPLVCNQIDVCSFLYTEICVDFKQEAEECHTYTFTIEIGAIQWNKHTS